MNNENKSQQTTGEAHVQAGQSRTNSVGQLGRGSILTEGREIRGGVGSVPSTAKPQVSIVAQKPSSGAVTPSATTQKGK